MDIIYVPKDIPSEYHYIKYSNYNYFDLFNTDRFSNNSTYDFYRVYYINGSYTYYKDTYNTSNYTNISTHNINISSENYYRPDFCNILMITFIIVFFAIFLFNIITSCIRKGGLFGGLL